MHDYILALSVYAAMVDRSAKRALKASAANPQSLNYHFQSSSAFPDRLRPTRSYHEPSSNSTKPQIPQSPSWWTVSSSQVSQNLPDIQPTVLHHPLSKHLVSDSIDPQSLKRTRSLPTHPSDVMDDQQNLRLLSNRSLSQSTVDSIPDPEPLQDPSPVQTEPVTPKSTPSSTSDSSGDSPAETPFYQIAEEHVQLFYHMLRHAESIYGLPMTFPSAPRISLTRLKDRAIICRRLGLSPQDLVLANFDTAPFLPAFYVAVDRQIHAIVICIRGTANLVDSLTDIVATNDPFYIRRRTSSSMSSTSSPSQSSGLDDQVTQDMLDNDDFVKGYGHSGFIRSARNVFHHIHDAALEAIGANPTFQLVVTGHSLGASTAAVLALMLRDDPDFPAATAVCIAPAPCMTYELAEQTASFTITLVNGPDIVPRLSVPIMLPFFATARYVAGLSRSKKTLLGFGLRRAVIDWKKLEQDTLTKTREMLRHHEDRRLHIPGRVFQMIRRNEVHRRDAFFNRLLGRREITLVPVNCANFLHVRGRERGMFLAHAPFNYRASLLLALKAMDAEPLPTMKVGSVLSRMINMPVLKLRSDSAKKGGGGIDSLDSLFQRLHERDGAPLNMENG